MLTSDFDYHLPEELIAQSPPERRDGSRMLVARRGNGALTHSLFSRLPSFLEAGDCLVFNDSRVMPARLIGRRAASRQADGGGAAVEVLLLRDTGDMVWECLTRPGRKTRQGQRIVFGEPRDGDFPLTGVITEEKEDGIRLIRLQSETPLNEALGRLGSVPLPPYIRETLADVERYQTVYSKHTGSAAAPTAGLHFTPETLDAVRSIGAETRFITLHVGLGTFRPVKAADISGHKMHTEYYHIPDETAEAVVRAKREGRRVVAVGTTVCRALESADCGGGVKPGAGSTGIFITPGYDFKVADAMLTNFHLPQSTLIMLVSAFLGHQKTMTAYAEAVKERYRFYSFGDAMLIL
ncbi:MAG: tRNA preQ1(34) S-adenosylmethionine ribosyltransferase-isomerase QueA [Oscillospiraceae bacterium]|nr:tRNA preQ1(34) S-adenosylmethionine ribosyltransferase-isomerase QueA [Oscillospiraceae bacterium]